MFSLDYLLIMVDNLYSVGLLRFLRRFERLTVFSLMAMPLTALVVLMFKLSVLYLLNSEYSLLQHDADVKHFMTKVIHMLYNKAMTIREKKYVEAKARGLSNTKAAMYATGTKSVNGAKTQGHRLSTNVNVQAALAKVFKKHDITLDNIVAPIGKALKAKKTIDIGRDKIVEGKGENRVVRYETITDTVDDLEMQLKGSDRAAKLLGLDKPGGDGNGNNNNLPYMDMEELAAAMNDGDEVTLAAVVFKKAG